MALAIWVCLAFASRFACRLSYFLCFGFTLKREDRTSHLSLSYGPSEGFRRFRRAAAAVMNNDALSFIALCVVTRRTLSVGLPPGWVVGAGAALVAVGVAMKLWAAVALGGGAYYCRNIFDQTA